MFWNSQGKKRKDRPAKTQKKEWKPPRVSWVGVMFFLGLRGRARYGRIPTAEEWSQVTAIWPDASYARTGRRSVVIRVDGKEPKAKDNRQTRSKRKLLGE
jgi:hypothetical protein